jgi:hypothetical protein
MTTTTRWQGAALAAALVLGLAAQAARAEDEKDASAVLDRAIKALGGEEKLSKVKAYSVKRRGSFTFNDNASEFSGQTTVQGTDHYRSEFESNANGNTFKAVTVIAGDKGWRKFGENSMELEGETLANEKRRLFLSEVAVLPTALKAKGFKLATAGEEKVADRPANVLKVTAPDGKDFKICFDKEIGVPVRVTATVVGFNNEEMTLETTYADYKDFDGIKKATKAEAKRDGQTFLQQEFTEFKVLDKVDPETFTEPK